MKNNAVMRQMLDRVAKGLDPLSGRPMQCVGKISWTPNGCIDETGRAVTLSDRGDWAYTDA